MYGKNFDEIGSNLASEGGITLPMAKESQDH